MTDYTNFTSEHLEQLEDRVWCIEEELKKWGTITNELDLSDLSKDELISKINCISVVSNTLLDRLNADYED